MIDHVMFNKLNMINIKVDMGKIVKTLNICRELNIENVNMLNSSQ